MSNYKQDVSAEKEYAKNPELKREDIAHLRKWLQTQPHLPAGISDEMLILFHHSCYYKLDRTTDCIETYYTLRTNNPEVFSNRDVRHPDLAQALSVFHFACLPKQDPNGNNIIYLGLKQYESSKYVFTENLKLLLMTMDASSKHTGTAAGTVVLFNMHGGKLSHLTRISLSVMRMIIHYIQEGNPVRLKAIYVINAVPFFDKCMALIKPFMKKELASLVQLHFHSGDMTTFYEQIPKDCLPSDFGGDLGTVEEICASHDRVLEGLAGYFKDEELLRVDESKRTKGKKDKNTEANYSFKQLSID